MHPATLLVHGVGVVTKLYFAIVEPFNESMTFNLAQRSSILVPIEIAHTHTTISGQ